ncbi:hypothetical protein EDB83DRAFT_2311436 [Lactarius deliciosus]|nr:hypothetical protein EDB83DRAFT_2311436 [Lactarius deliciosus]
MTTESVDGRGGHLSLLLPRFNRSMEKNWFASPELLYNSPGKKPHQTGVWLDKRTAIIITKMTARFCIFFLMESFAKSAVADRPTKLKVAGPTQKRGKETYICQSKNRACFAALLPWVPEGSAVLRVLRCPWCGIKPENGAISGCDRRHSGGQGGSRAMVPNDDEMKGPERGDDAPKGGGREVRAARRRRSGIIILSLNVRRSSPPPPLWTSLRHGGLETRIRATISPDTPRSGRADAVTVRDGLSLGTTTNMDVYGSGHAIDWKVHSGRQCPGGVKRKEDFSLPGRAIGKRPSARCVTTTPGLLHVMRINDDAGWMLLYCCSVLAEGTQGGKRRNGTKTTTVTVVKACRVNNNESMYGGQCGGQTPNQTPV